MNKGFFRDDIGNRSMNRLLAFMAGLSGCITIAAGIVVVFLALLVSEKGDGMTQGLGMIASGAGLLAGAEALKNTGRSLEK